MTSFLGVIGILAGVMIALGVAYAVFTSSKTKTTLELYKGEAEAEKTRGDRLERENGELERRNVALERRITGLEEAAKVLASQVSGVVAVKELESKVAVWRTEESGLLDSIIGKLTEVIDGLPKRAHESAKLGDICAKVDKILEEVTK